MSNTLKQPALVLNKSWIAVNTCCIQRALKLAYKERAKIVDPDPWDAQSGKSEFATYDLFGWIDRGIFKDKSVIELGKYKIQNFK